MFSDKPRVLEGATPTQYRRTGSFLYLLGWGPTWLVSLKEHKMKSEDPPGWPASRCIGPKRVREVSKEGMWLTGPAPLIL